MPSLLNTTVAANYGKMTAQDTYGTGPAFTGFGTRSLRLLKVVLSSGSLNDLTYADGNATGTYADANSLFGKVVAGLQQTAEIYVVGQPDATSFLALVAGDTINDAAAASNVAGTTYGAMEAQLKSIIDNRTAAMGAGAAGTATTVTVTASGTAANPNFFVGATVGTFA